MSDTRLKEVEDKIRADHQPLSEKVITKQAVKRLAECDKYNALANLYNKVTPLLTDPFECHHITECICALLKEISFQMDGVSFTEKEREQVRESLVNKETAHE